MDDNGSDAFDRNGAKRVFVDLDRSFSNLKSIPHSSISPFFEDSKMIIVIVPFLRNLSPDPVDLGFLRCTTENQIEMVYSV